MKQILIFALSLLSSALTITPAVAQQTATSIVRTADLDLASEAGREALDRRISAAVIEVCGTASSVDLEGRNAVRNCRDETFAKIAAERDQLLAAARNGAPIAIAAR